MGVLRCIDNDNRRLALTIGKLYNVEWIGEHDEYYVKNDDDKIESFWHGRFEIANCKEQKEKDNLQYSIVTKDEYILNFIKRFGGNKERATESFKNIAQGYNFIFTIGDNQYYSVDYINKLLER